MIPSMRFLARCPTWLGSTSINYARPVVARTLATTGRAIDDLIKDDHREIFALWNDFQSTLPEGPINSQQTGSDKHVKSSSSDKSMSHHAESNPGSSPAESSTLSYDGSQIVTGSDNTHQENTTSGNNSKPTKGNSDQGTFKSNTEARKSIANSLLRAIAVHSVAEEIVVYPEIRLIHGDTVADKLIADQQEVKNSLYQLDQMPVTHPDYFPRLQRVMRELELHIKEEEDIELPELRAQFEENWLQHLGDRFLAARHLVPTRPHPSAPTIPSLEALVGSLIAPFDKIRDLRRDFAKPSTNVDSSSTR